MATTGIDIGSIDTKARRGPAASPRLRTPLGVSIAAHLAIGLTAIALLRFLPSETASDAPEAIEVSIVSGLPGPSLPMAEIIPAPPTPSAQIDGPAPQPHAQAMDAPEPAPLQPTPPAIPPAPVPVETAATLPPPVKAQPKPAKPIQRPKAPASAAKLVAQPMVEPVATAAPSPAVSADQKSAGTEAEHPTAAPVSTAATNPSPAAETRSGLEDTPPLILNPRFRETPTPPTYPKRAMDLDQQGEALVRARLDADGNPSEIVLWRTSGFDLLDHAALEAVRRWRFQPAERDGHPIPAWVQVPIHFALK